MRVMASRLFAQPFFQAQFNENIKAPRHWPLLSESTIDRWLILIKDHRRLVHKWPQWQMSRSVGGDGISYGWGIFFVTMVSS